MRGLMLVVVVVVCVACVLGDEGNKPEDKPTDMSCGPKNSDPMGQCMKCKTCKKNPQFTLCNNRKAKKECRKSKGKGWCCCVNPKPSEMLPAWCRIPRKKRPAKKAVKKTTPSSPPA